MWMLSTPPSTAAASLDLKGFQTRYSVLSPPSACRQSTQSGARQTLIPVASGVARFSLEGGQQLLRTSTAILFSPYTLSPGTMFLVTSASSLPRAMKMPSWRCASTVTYTAQASAELRRGEQSHNQDWGELGQAILASRGRRLEIIKRRDAWHWAAGAEGGGAPGRLPSFLPSWPPHRGHGLLRGRRRLVHGRRHDRRHGHLHGPCRLRSHDLWER